MVTFSEYIASAFSVYINPLPEVFVQ